MTDSEHVLSICNEWVEDTYWGECSCGKWEGPQRSSQTEVVDDFENHCDVVFTRATENDGET